MPEATKKPEAINEEKKKKQKEEDLVSLPSF